MTEENYNDGQFSLINQLKCEMDHFSSKLSKLGLQNEYSKFDKFDSDDSKYNLNKYFQDKNRAIN